MVATQLARSLEPGEADVNGQRGVLSAGSIVSGEYLAGRIRLPPARSVRLIARACVDTRNFRALRANSSNKASASAERAVCFRRGCVGVMLRASQCRPRYAGRSYY
jgi:hypothetical protein